MFGGVSYLEMEERNFQIRDTALHLVKFLQNWTF